MQKITPKSAENKYFNTITTHTKYHEKGRKIKLKLKKKKNKALSPTSRAAVHPVNLPQLYKTTSY
jgi:hypothetical protein